MANPSLIPVSVAPPHSGVPATSTSTTPTPVTMVPSLSAVAAATSSLKAAQFSTMMTTMQQSITSLRAELRRDQDETVEKATRKVRLSAEVTFRRKGNEKQYRFNKVVQDKFSSAAIRIDEAATNVAAWLFGFNFVGSAEVSFSRSVVCSQAG